MAKTALCIASYADALSKTSCIILKSEYRIVVYIGNKFKERPQL